MYDSRHGNSQIVLSCLVAAECFKEHSCGPVASGIEALQGSDGGYSYEDIRCWMWNK